MRIAICDDNNSEGKLVADIIRSFADQSNLNIQISQFTDGENMLAAAGSEPFDL